MLGGDPGSGVGQVFDDWATGLREPNVRGLIPGRTLLYPHDGDVPLVMRRAALLLTLPNTSRVVSSAKDRITEARIHDTRVSCQRRSVPDARRLTPRADSHPRRAASP